MEKDKIVKILREYFEKEDAVVFAYLFGSYAKGKLHEKSDVDVAVYLNERIAKDSKKVLEFQIKHMSNISDILRREVDLVVLNQASPLLRHEVISEGILLLEKDHDKLVNFKKMSFYYYQDWLHIMKIKMMYIKERIAANGKKRVGQ
ncbi:putative nucleotidyltransferase [Caldicellulosiruptor bescii]|uniref:DNA polymerase beta domain protein region n=3 Tax=Caldicellulosiruptor bescii TaxID=31899 RepID=B9MKA8_CALBD|nr:nucleotidyltransferase domain-containing protein [Caldicellulosiruptor bescii]ACM60766.1 DNA polymerase beta domain protein region [Caldicellulosiruptor bescii DSM 6725]PBC89417.1 putative nucleotidyltransferase [Caldicellulosiruptor bescii]PBC91098.1 putative nucleotidyltransferase [Caldicellulosiruptor bescii]PBD03488.1 putative nucleotidyltransferase [Caldicellulosiruptor bescii]PBD06897.1 putative nucleotidyltransferase [Caldicellulosiruptor bescii]